MDGSVRKTSGPVRTVKSRGPDTPTLVSSLAAMVREATVAKKPGRRGERV
jgi:hypothetical protein